MKYLLHNNHFKLEVIIKNESITTKLLYFDEKVRGKMAVNFYKDNLMFTIRISSESYSAIYTDTFLFNVVINGSNVAKDRLVMTIPFPTNRSIVENIIEVLNQNNAYILKNLKVV